MSKNKKTNIMLPVLLIIVLFLAFNLIREKDKFKELQAYKLEIEDENKLLLEENKKLNLIIEENKLQEILDTKKGDDTSPTNKELRKKEILFYSQEDLKNLTKEAMDYNNIEKIYASLTQEDTWINQGFTEDDGRAIASRFKSNPDQSKDILRGIIQRNKSLKIVLIPMGDILKVNIGSAGPNPK